MKQITHAIITPLRKTITWIVSHAMVSEAGEGVISAAIAVLIMAFLGVVMWLAFKTMLGHTMTTVSNVVSKIGQ